MAFITHNIACINLPPTKHSIYTEVLMTVYGRDDKKLQNMT